MNNRTQDFIGAQPGVIVPAAGLVVRESPVGVFRRLECPVDCLERPRDVFRSHGDKACREPFPIRDSRFAISYGVPNGRRDKCPDQGRADDGNRPGTA